MVFNRPRHTAKVLDALKLAGIREFTCYMDKAISKENKLEQEKLFKLFQEIDWKPLDPPKIGRSALGGSPPPIPHSLQLRENCLACHGGAAAVRGIRSSHPERINCRQCHVKIMTRINLQ